MNVKIKHWEGASDKAKEAVAKILILVVLMFGASEVIENNRPKLVFEQRGWVNGDKVAEDMPEMAESMQPDRELVQEPKAQEESTRLEADSHSVTLIKKVAEEEGIDWKLLYAICKVESNCTPETIGDHGDSWGAFQINKPAHPTLTQKEAFDIEWSAKWTANHGKAYKDNPNLFFKNHNGIGKTTNDWYVERCNKIYASL